MPKQVISQSSPRPHPYMVSTPLPRSVARGVPQEDADSDLVHQAVQINSVADNLDGDAFVAVAVANGQDTGFIQVDWNLVNASHNPLSGAARFFVRNCAPLVSFGELIRVAGPVDQEHIADEKQISTERRQELCNQWQTLLDLAPCLPSAIRHFGVASTEKMLSKFSELSRSSDAKRVKDAIVNMCDFDPPLANLDKGLRGFRHDDIALLICPPSEREIILQDASLRQAYLQGTRKLDAGVLPAFLYDNFVVSDNIWRGLLKSQLLVKAARVVFYGPSTLTRSKTQRVLSPAQRRKIAGVGIASVCYVATLVYFALSSDRTFRFGGELCSVSYIGFYNNLMEMLRNCPTTRRERLMQWWLKELVPYSANPERLSIRGVSAVELLAQDLSDSEDDYDADDEDDELDDNDDVTRTNGKDVQ